MISKFPNEDQKYRAFVRGDIDQIRELKTLPSDEILAMKAVSAVLPFRANNYVVEELIRWDKVPDDPIYQLTFPQRGMLETRDFERMFSLVRAGAPEGAIQAAAREIQRGMNPHPAGQLDLNVPERNGARLTGMQHKYRETVLFFPSQGQTCHAYCTYCFRWAQFVGMQDLRFASREAEQLVHYLRDHPEVSDVLFTGGDPAIMKASVLRKYIEPLLSEDLEHLTSIRLGTKAPAYWPYRFLTDPDADELLALFEEVHRAGKHLALMAHFTHPRELETPAAEAALRRIVETGAVVRCQAPLVRHVNDNAAAWSRMWRMQVQFGAVPYYMFVERDTGAKRYFEVPLARAFEIYRDAIRDVSGLARTVRGPSMSASPGKVKVDGVARIHGRKYFVLSLLQARNPEWVGRPFFADYDERATWLDDLRPAFGDQEFFWEAELREMSEAATGAVEDGWVEFQQEGSR